MPYIDVPSQVSRSELENEIVALIIAYYKSEIGRLMQQAEHWAQNDRPMAVHHRVTAADDYFQVVAMFERHGQFDQDVFDVMRESVTFEQRTSASKPHGKYPPSAELHRYRDPVYVAALASGQQAQPSLADVYVPGAWRCPKCNFTLMQASLSASDGSVASRDEPGDKCPNCNKPLWRVTWSEHANELAARLEQEFISRRGDGEDAQ